MRYNASFYSYNVLKKAIILYHTMSSKPTFNWAKLVSHWNGVIPKLLER